LGGTIIRTLTEWGVWRGKSPLIPLFQRGKLA
jgi:hypothetical protein